MRLRHCGLVLLAFGLAACEDPSGESIGPGGDARGTWVVETQAGVQYIRVLPTTIEVYSPADTCFQVAKYAITAIDGRAFTVVPAEDSVSSLWLIEREGEMLSVDFGAVEMLLEPTDIDVATIPVCGGPAGDFPHPPCSLIDPVTIGGTVTGALGPGDALWTDDTYYDLWSLQLGSAANVSITMLADDPDALDTYLMLYDAAAVERLAENDDIDFGGGNYNSRVTMDLEAGCYIIVANSYAEDPDPGGGYSLSVVTN